MTNLPSKLNTIFEVTLLGTGGGYGESIIIHMGNDEWAIIDSCINPLSQEILPLNYLNDKKVKLENIKLIICTHWHDDHIRGISNILENCLNARFAMASSTDMSKFLLWVGLDSNKAKSDSSISSTNEITKCFEILTKRHLPLKRAMQDRLLYSLKAQDIDVKIWSLSPSEQVLDEYDGEISTLISEYGKPNKKVIINTPNDKSVALFIEANNKCVLLGSDLEVTLDKRKGWHCILESSTCINSKKVSVFKIPHHGSKTGYTKEIWENIIEPNAIAKLSPYNKGYKLPNEEMLFKFLEHTDKLYITSSINVSNKPKDRDSNLKMTILKFNKSLTEVKYRYGIISCMINLQENTSDWDVNFDGQAKKISRDNMNH